MKKEKQKKKGKIADILLGFIYIIAFAVCGALMASETEGLSAKDSFIKFILLLAVMYLALTVQLIVHEAGHLVFGLLSGYKFKSFNVFGFVILKTNGKIRFCRENIAGMGGQCLMTPPEMKDGKIPVFIYNYGGAFLNLILSAVSLCLYLFMPHIEFLSPFFLYLTVIGISFALANGIPFKGTLISNDGYNALSLGRDKDALRGLWLQLMINSLSSDGVALKDMPEEFFTVPTDEQMKNTMIAPIAVFASNRYTEQHRFEEADALMKRLLEMESGIVGLHKNLMICDRLYIELISENRKDAVDAFLTKEEKNFMKSMKTYPTVMRTEYAYALLCNEDEEKAEKIKAQFEKCAKHYPYEADIKTERTLMQLAYEKFSKAELK